MTAPLECSLPTLRIKRSRFPLLFARETEQNGREVTARFLPTDTVTPPAQKAFNQRLVQTYVFCCTFEHVCVRVCVPACARERVCTAPSP